ncbi:MAG: HEAT-like repeat [Paramarteilia canceri]
MIDSSTQSQDGQQAVQLLTLLRQLQSENNETRDNGEKILNQIKYDFLLQQTESILFANEGVSDSEKIFLSTILKNRLPGFGTRSKKEMLSKNAFETLLKVFFNLKNLPSSDVQTNFDIFDHLVIPALRMIGHKDYSSSKNEFFNKLSENLDTTGSLLSPIMSFGVYSQCDEDLVKDHVVSILPQVYETQQKIATIITGVNVMDSNSTILTIQYFSYLCNLLAKMPQGVKPVEMLVSLINICQYLIVNKKIENSSQMIDSLQELAVVKPRLFKQVIQDVINLIIYVMKDSKNNHMIKISAINLFILLYTGLSQTMCKYEQELNEFVSHLAYCMTIPVEFSEKMPNLQTTNNDTQEYDENDQDDKYEMDMEHISRQAEVAFDKMCCLTPDFMYPKVEEYVSKYLSSDSTEDQKVGGLSMLCCAAEGCKKFYEKFLERIMNVLVFPYTYESQYSSKVRYTALTALGQMCSDFGASLIRKMHSEMLQTYKKALENSSSLKVQCFAYTALNNFISVCPSYLIDEVVEFLNPTIQKTLSQEPFSLNLFTNIIDFLIPLTETQAVIPPYLYLTVRPTILQVIQQYGSQDLNLLSKSLLTLCQLGMHAEKIKFQEDARMVMDCSMNVLQTSLRSNSHSNIDFENFIISFEVMVKVFGQDFLPYVDFMIQICKELMEEVFSTNYDKFMNYLESEDVEGEVVFSNNLNY